MADQKLHVEIRNLGVHIPCDGEWYTVGERPVTGPIRARYKPTNFPSGTPNLTLWVVINP